MTDPDADEDQGAVVLRSKKKRELTPADIAWRLLPTEKKYLTQEREAKLKQILVLERSNDLKSRRHTSTAQKRREEVKTEPLVTEETQMFMARRYRTPTKSSLCTLTAKQNEDIRYKIYDREP